MPLNPKRKQQYLDGEVGLIYNQEPIDRLWMIDPNVYGNNQIYWRSDKTPESFKTVEWFFEEDVVIPDIPKTPLQTAIEKLKQQKERIDQASCVPYDKTVRIIQIQHDITILESLLPEERETMCRFAVKYSIEEDYDAHTLFNRTFKR